MTTAIQIRLLQSLWLALCMPFLILASCGDGSRHARLKEISESLDAPPSGVTSRQDSIIRSALAELREMPADSLEWLLSNYKNILEEHFSKNDTTSVKSEMPERNEVAPSNDRQSLIGEIKRRLSDLEKEASTNAALPASILESHGLADQVRHVSYHAVHPAWAIEVHHHVSP